MFAAQFALAVLILIYIRPRHGVEPAGIRVNDTVRITIFDTVRYALPVAKDSILLRYVTKVVPAKPLQWEPPEIGDSTAACFAFAAPDSVEVLLPITQSHYFAPEYEAWISGHRPRLDSIRVFPRHEVTTITASAKSKRWAVGLQAGYGITLRGLQPYLGVGIAVRLWP